MNFIDLCAACGRAIGRGCTALWRMLQRMVRLTYRYWWIVLTMVALAIAAALYYSRPGNVTYKMNAVALLNGPSITQFEQAYAPLRSGKMLPEGTAIDSLAKQKIAKRFDTYRVIDCLNDGVADYIDFKRRSSAVDTVNVQMQDRLCLQFRIKTRDMAKVPEIEQAVLDWLNSNAALQQSYQHYLPNLRNQAAFNHNQWSKLDSLTSAYYFQTTLGERVGVGNGFMFVGDRRVELFLEDIYDQQARTELTDYRLQLAYAPVVLENHFAADPKPINGRKKCVLLFFLLGWIAGCVTAELIDKRKAISAWLKA